MLAKSFELTKKYLTEKNAKLEMIQKIKTQKAEKQQRNENALKLDGQTAEESDDEGLLTVDEEEDEEGQDEGKEDGAGAH